MMSEGHVKSKRWVIILGILCLIWAVGGQVLRCDADEITGAAYVETVRGGLAYRESAIRTLTGIAEIEWTFSPANCERGRKDAEEYAKRTNWIGEVLPLDPTHKSSLDFGVDFDMGHWRCDGVDLTVSGHMLWTSTNDPALNRHLPPETFRHVSICDGVKVYDHHWGLKHGWIELYTGKTWQVPGPLLRVQEMIRGVTPSIFARLSDPRYEVAFQGEEDAGGYRSLKVHLSRKDLSAGGKAVTLWVAPDLDFAVVRQAYDGYAPGSSPDAAPVLIRTLIKEMSEFAKVSDLLWCPLTLEITYYQYEPGRPPQHAWDHTQVIRLKSVELNRPVGGITTPYEFPSGTEVTDHASGTVITIGEGED